MLNTSSDCSSFSAKADAWNEAVKEFNVGATQTRIKDAVTTLFDATKVAVKRAYREWNQRQTRTRNVTPFEALSNETKRIYSLISQDLHLHYLNRPPLQLPLPPLSTLYKGCGAQHMLQP